ncbi:hypothetical protein Tco_0350447, partial [Tanacetum coccineum]
ARRAKGAARLDEDPPRSVRSRPEKCPCRAAGSFEVKKEKRNRPIRRGVGRLDATNFSK